MNTDDDVRQKTTSTYGMSDDDHVTLADEVGMLIQTMREADERDEPLARWSDQ